LGAWLSVGHPRRIRGCPHSVFDVALSIGGVGPGFAVGVGVAQITAGC
jgi:hypothetical protein